jgi:hypothetical protein
VFLWAIATALLAAAGGLLVRRRIERAAQAESSLDDDVIRSIETHGYVEVEDHEPLDLEEISEEEERFWEDETWEEKEEW